MAIFFDGLQTTEEPKEGMICVPMSIIMRYISEPWLKDWSFFSRFVLPSFQSPCSFEVIHS